MLVSFVRLEKSAREGGRGEMRMIVREREREREREGGGDGAGEGQGGRGRGRGRWRVGGWVEYLSKLPTAPMVLSSM